MKKYVFAVITIFLGFSAFSQVKMGLKVSPNFSWNSVTFGQDSVYDYSGNGMKIRGGAGVIVDFNLSDNFAFSTGANYNTKGAGFKVSYADTSGATAEIKSTYALQYLEVPISFKVFTNEIMDYTKMYFQVGVTENVNIGAKVNGEKVFTDSNGDQKPYTKNINTFGTSLLIGTGIEMEMGESTMLLAGISYNRGLFNIDNTKTFVSPNKITNEYISIDLGLKF